MAGQTHGGILGVFYAGPGVGLEDPYGSLPAQGILGFCEHMCACVMTGDHLYSERMMPGSSLGISPFGEMTFPDQLSITRFGDSFSDPISLAEKDSLICVEEEPGSTFIMAILSDPVPGPSGEATASCWSPGRTPFQGDGPSLPQTGLYVAITSFHLGLL